MMSEVYHVTVISLTKHLKVGQFEEEMEGSLKGLFERFRFKNIIEGVVVAVNDHLCNVQIENGPLLEDVRLQVIEDQVSSFIRVSPKLGSVVVVGVVVNVQSEYVIIQTSEIDDVWIKVGENEYRLNATKHLVKNGDDEMWDGLKLLFEAIEPIIILKGRNPDKLKLALSKAKLKRIYNGT